jgi:hypothetical protein
MTWSLKQQKGLKCQTCRLQKCRDGLAVSQDLVVSSSIRQMLLVTFGLNKIELK